MQRSETIQTGGATAATVDISMAVGELQISGGAAELMEADFTYDEELEPRIDYRVTADRGTLTIEQESRQKLRTTRNEWDIRLNNDVPIDLTTGIAAAGATLHVDDLTLSSLRVSTAAGDASVSSAGNQPELGQVSIETASGDVRVNLSGSYQSVSSVDVSSAAGDIDLDLSGEWSRDVDISVDGVAGDARIQVPSGVGVAVRSTSMVGRISLDGFRRHEDSQVNAAFGSAPVTMRLKITTISGNVTVTEAG